MNTLTQQYRDAQAEYQRTLGPWIAAREARDTAQAHLVSLPKVTRVSRTQYHRGVSEISTASITLKQADRAWKEAKKVRYVALQEVWRSGWHLKDAQDAWKAIHEIPPVPGQTLSFRHIVETKDGYRATLTWTTGETRTGESTGDRAARVEAVKALRDLVWPPESKKKHPRR